MTTANDPEQGRAEALRQILHDLTEEDWWPFEPGDRLWKLYVVRPASGRATQLAHYIYTKQKPNGQLALVTFAIHRPAGDRAVRSGIARVADLSPDALDHIIETIQHETKTDDDEHEMFDLTGLPALAGQLAYLRDLAQALTSARDLDG